jgi:hypothetical protein
VGLHRRLALAVERQAERVAEVARQVVAHVRHAVRVAEQERGPRQRL